MCHAILSLLARYGFSPTSDYGYKARILARSLYSSGKDQVNPLVAAFKEGAADKFLPTVDSPVARTFY
jgi:hypothetical protein